MLKLKRRVGIMWSARSEKFCCVCEGGLEEFCGAPRVSVNASSPPCYPLLSAQRLSLGSTLFKAVMHKLSDTEGHAGSSPGARGLRAITSCIYIRIHMILRKR